VREAPWFAGLVGADGDATLEALTQVLFDLADLVQCAEALDLSLGLRHWSPNWDWWRPGRFQTHTTDVEVFLEAVRLKEVGEFEGADVAAAVSDFTLKVSDDPAQVLRSEAGTQPFIPLPLSIKAQAKTLTGQLAVELVSGGDLLGTDVRVHGHSGLGAGSRWQ